MAISWLSVLQAVPWGQVIDNAPKVVDGAKKLWNNVSGKQAPEEFEVPDEEQAVSGSREDLSILSQRLAAMEKSTSELHKQMVASSALIKELADQNTQLIRHMEVNRVRMFWLIVLFAVTAIIAVAALIMALLPSGV